MGACGWVIPRGGTEEYKREYLGQGVYVLISFSLFCAIIFQKKVMHFGVLSWQTRVKLLCSVLGLPFPTSENGLAEEANNLACRNMPDYLERRILQKLLLVGCDGSGTSTIFKQVLPK